ncbi:hypothetical protein [Photorhabdus luminescens]|uniref:Uncharacterized protein n=1 Tax=Photorhabdus luminescens subsp. mexicana TaxID=2100167 RepID=A0A4R4ITZ8_PHOLU|nr:hypothetical protein [Photorhabdus luminescens]TDB44293.1 hypothetical protein C5468_22500 [Photorhabdus luminescens subsp. mexicana]
MNILNENWEPGFGTIFTWFAMDKHGRISVMVNNCFGNLPRALLLGSNPDELLDHLNEYMWEESEQYNQYPENKSGKTKLDLYSSLVYRHYSQRSEVEQWVNERASPHQNLREYNLPSIKGFFVYHGIEGSNPGQDYPIGYDGETKMGDYFRYLIPTVYASIDDFPKELRRGIAVSNTIDFTVDRLLNNDLINTYFTRMYAE